MQSFFRELRRRNVYRVGAMYAVGGWLLVQVATQVLPIFDVGAGALRLIVLAIIAGFPVALVLSWVYEVTPQGIARTADVPETASIAHRTGRRLDFVIIGVLALAVVFLVVQHYVLPRRNAPAAAVVSDKSIAVLPFENLSDEKASAYFATGIQDEILTRLAKIGALKVISRTSTQHYASTPSNLPDIARELGVAHILEGSVQKAGDAVHINVQLIRAATDDHLWAEVYNRKLDDIFAVEAEVAGAIAEALNAKLTGAEQNAVAERPTANLAAYDAFLQGRTLSLAGYDYATSRKAAAAYAEAVRLDPDFAVAWADLGRVAGYLYFNGVDTDVYTAAYVKHASDQAIGLQPQLVEAQLSHANYLYRIERNFAAAAKVLDGIVASAPNNNEAWQFRGLVVRRQGLWKEALADLEKAAELDPRNAGLMTAIGGETLLNLRRYDEARQWLERALSISPGNALVTGYLISSYQTEGRLTDAARLIDTIPAAGIDPFVAFSRVQQRLFERRFDVAIVELDPVLARNDPSLDGQRPLLTLNRALALRAAGKKDAARATLEPLVASLAPDAERVDDTLLPLLQARALAYLGRDAEAIAQARRAVELFRDDGIDAPQAQQTLAEVLALSGDHAGAIAILESVVDKPVGLSPALLRLDPIWDPLRGEPRFDALAARPDKPAL